MKTIKAAIISLLSLPLLEATQGQEQKNANEDLLIKYQKSEDISNFIEKWNSLQSGWNKNKIITHLGNFDEKFDPKTSKRARFFSTSNDYEKITFWPDLKAYPGVNFEVFLVDGKLVAKEVILLGNRVDVLSVRDHALKSFKNK